MNKITREVRENCILEYKQAVWQYVLDHSDVTDGGALFVKFHTDSRKSFENHVFGRIMGYKREDTEMKQSLMATKSEEHQRLKREKRGNYVKAKNKRKMLNKIKSFFGAIAAFLGQIGCDPGVADEAGHFISPNEKEC